MNTSEYDPFGATCSKHTTPRLQSCSTGRSAPAPVLACPFLDLLLQTHEAENPCHAMLSLPCRSVAKPYRVTSPPHQFAEKQEAERRAKEEEEERQRQEAEAAEEALRRKPKSKTEEVNELLRVKLAERLELCRELLVLLRRAQEKASVCTSSETT